MTGAQSHGDTQRDHWDATFASNPDMYGTQASQPAQAALDLFAAHAVTDVVELGAGQGRDTLAFLTAGHRVTALDYSAEALGGLTERAAAVGCDQGLQTVVHDVREPLPLPDSSADAVYSHMLFSMALTSAELEALATDVRRVLRPGGWHIYTVRHTGDAHFGSGRYLGENCYENGGFAVHFFDQPLVERLAVGYELDDITEFEEGDLPRRLWRITMHSASRGGDGHAFGAA